MSVTGIYKGHGDARNYSVFWVGGTEFVGTFKKGFEKNFCGIIYQQSLVAPGTGKTVTKLNAPTDLTYKVWKVVSQEF